MPNAELVEHIGIGARDVGDRVVAEHQPLEHRLVDGAADLLLVRPHWLEAGLRNRGRDEAVIDLGGIGDPAGRRGLGAERHEDEAERRQLVDRVHEIVLCPRCKPPGSSITMYGLKLGQNRPSSGMPMPAKSVSVKSKSSTAKSTTTKSSKPKPRAKPGRTKPVR